MAARSKTATPTTEAPAPTRKSPVRKKPAANKKPAAPTLAVLAATLARLENSVAELTLEVRSAASIRSAPEVGSLGALGQQLAEVSEALSVALSEAPKASDFQPLADHLYELARNAPQLQAALEEAPRVAEPIQTAVRALQELSEMLHFTQERFAETVLRLPRADEYEPLAGPLVEFARVSPILARSLDEVLRVAAPLGEAVRELRAIAERLEALSAQGASVVPQGVNAAAATMKAGRDAIVEAVAALPSDAEYARFAGQLRELATVSPSLMEWLSQVKPLSAPLTSSVRSLLEAAEQLELGHQALLALARSERS